MPARAVTSRRRARPRRGTPPGAPLGGRVSGFGGAAVGTVAAAAALAGCAGPTVDVPAAPFADDPVCAEVVLGLPAVLAEAERIDTTSQGTAAWTHDAPADAIVLRCGVEPLPPTTEQCVTATDGTGVSVDWVTVAGDETAGTPWSFTTYGREPAVEVTVPTSVTAERSTSFLVDLGVAVSRTEQVRQCL
jgi:hypothetical protein